VHLGEGEGGHAVTIRRATIADYGAFAALFPELGIDDPLPGPEVWASAYVPFTRVAGDAVLGYCYTEELDDTGYVRNVVVAPGARRRGVGRALMETTARQLREAGKTSWRLNVAPQNAAALALYESVGLTTLYASRAVRLPWASARELPSSHAEVRELPRAGDADVEASFALPRGQLTAARGAGRVVLVAAAEDRPYVGVAVLAPAFPGAFPFRVRAPEIARPLVEAMRPRAAPGAHVNLVVDDDEDLVRLFVEAGGEVRGDFLHLGGRL
jgi:ribosomal protein S18 acetylase RimI-like enzyme